MLEVKRFCPYINIVHKFALVNAKKKINKIDRENVFGDIGTKEGVPMKIKSKLMSKVNFI